MTERTYPGTIAAICREALAGRAERVTLTEERTGGDGRARFDVVIGGERFRVSVERNPLLDIEIGADGVPRATRALGPDETITISPDALRALYWKADDR